MALAPVLAGTIRTRLHSPCDLNHILTHIFRCGPNCGIAHGYRKGPARAGGWERKRDELSCEETARPAKPAHRTRPGSGAAGGSQSGLSAGRRHRAVFSRSQAGSVWLWPDKLVVVRRRYGGGTSTDSRRSAACWAYRRSRPPIPTDRDHLFRTIATSSAARVLTAPLDDGGDVSLLGVGQARREAVPVVNRRDPRATRSALMADAAACAGGPC
jgi:hypothetical protein